MKLSERDVRHVFEQLRKGLVPERGLEAFAAGIEKPRGELHRQLALAKDGEGTIKFLRGGYGCGKTFMARLALLDARERNFATSFTVVSDSGDLRFHRFDDVYRKIMGDLGTQTCPRGALSDILDRWIGRIEDRLIDGGADEDAPDFDDTVQRELKEELHTGTQGKAPQDFIRVVQTIFELKQEGALAEAGSLLSWLSGSGNVAAGAKKRAGIKGDITSRDALDYLRGVLAIIRQAGYAGLCVVIDEAETIRRMRGDTRAKSLNGIRQIADAAGDYPGLMWLFTGTAEFYDARDGVAALAPLHDRIKFIRHGDFVSLRQPQLELRPFDPARLEMVALKLRDLYVAEARERIDERVTDGFIRQMVAQVSEGFREDVGVVPRQFLRAFVTLLDVVNQEEGFHPAQHFNFEPQGLSDEEQRVLDGDRYELDAGDAELVAEEDVW